MAGVTTETRKVTKMVETEVEETEYVLRMTEEEAGILVWTLGQMSGDSKTHVLYHVLLGSGVDHRRPDTNPFTTVSKRPFDEAG